MLFLTVLLLVSSASASVHELLPYNPKPNPSSIVESGNARFTILTPSLIRMEYQSSRAFEDRATLAVVNRYLPTPQFSQSTQNGWLTITTSKMTLSYQVGMAFSSSSLKISGSAFGSWNFGDKNEGNLLGTIRSLDELDVISLNCTENANTTVHGESLHCQWGLISRRGWAIVDDSTNWCLDNENDWWTSKNNDQVDQYFFGHGLDYKAALFDYTLIGGKTAMPPRSSTGIWWSRWYDLNNADVLAIVQKYEMYSIPLDIFILDMDWHTKNAWGGYTVDTRLFPIPKEFMEALHDKGLLIGANIHDADGINPWEKTYPEVAKALGVKNNAAIPFRVCDNMSYAYALEDIVLADVEKQGMDFWWIDWQQGGNLGGCVGEQQNPTIWLNKLRCTDRIRKNDPRRAMVLARWGGLGNHRYQVGFSGDVNTLSWSNLAFQPYYSFTASNVLYGFWSHDLVGPPADHELHTRWLQWGAYSAIFRTHDRGMANGYCGNFNPSLCAIVEVWNVPQMYFDANRDAMVGRAELIPYIYTASRQAFDTGISILRPMYYDFPNQDAAYLGDETGKFGQYMFGDNIMVAPVLTQGSKDTTMALTTVWIPPGQWYEKESGNFFSQGGQGSVYAKWYDLSEIPVFIRGGAIIPKIPIKTGNTIGRAGSQYHQLVFAIYPGASSGQTQVYEDDGSSVDYINDGFTWTKVSYTRSSTSISATVAATPTKPYPSFPSMRTYTFEIVSLVPPTSVSINGMPVNYQRAGGPNTWRYHGPSLTVIVESHFHKTDEAVNLVVNHPSFDQKSLDGVKGRLIHALKAKAVLDVTNDAMGSNNIKGGKLQSASSVGQTLSYLAGLDRNAFMTTLSGFDALYTAAVAEVLSQKPQIEETGLNPTHWGHAYTLLQNP